MSPLNALDSFDYRTAECLSPSLTTGSSVITTGALIIVVNVIVCIKLVNSTMTRAAARSIQVLCMSSILRTGVIVTCTCVLLFTCYLDLPDVCELQGFVARLSKTSVILVTVMFYMESFSGTLTNRDNRQRATVIFVLATIIWIVATCMTALPFFTYRVYPGHFSCDMSNVSLLMTSDSLLYCCSGVFFLGISISLRTADSRSRTDRTRTSYTLPAQAVPRHSVVRLADIGFCLAIGIFLEWTARIGAVLSPHADAGRSLFTIAICLEFLRSLCIPALLCVVMRGCNEMTPSDPPIGVVMDTTTTTSTTTTTVSDLAGSSLPRHFSHEETTVIRRVSVSVHSDIADAACDIRATDNRTHDHQLFTVNVMNGNTGSLAQQMNIAN